MGLTPSLAGWKTALKHSTRIKPVVVRHEQATSFMTCGYAVYSNRLSMRFATAGLGAFNLFSGLAIAISDLLPDSAIVLADAAAHLAWLGYFLQLKRGQHYRKFGIFGPIGLDRERCAVGTKIAFPERLMIVGCGDGCHLLSALPLHLHLRAARRFPRIAMRCTRPSICQQRRHRDAA